MENAETAETAEGPAPAPAPAATLEIVHERPHSQEHLRSQQTTLGDQPVQIVTFTYGLYLNLD